MAKARKQSILNLPQTNDIWYLGSKPIRTWIVEEEDEPIRPYVILVINLTTGMIHDVNTIGRPPSGADVEKLLFEAMQKPKKGTKIEPGRPSQVYFEDRELMNEVASTVQAAGVSTKFRPQTELLQEIVAELEEHMREGRPEIPGLLTQPGVNTRLVSSVFEAAADFYDAAPWVHLKNEDVLAIRVLPEKDPYYVIVMGYGGVEYGLALYKTWEAVKRQFLSESMNTEQIDPSGMHSFLFDEITLVPFDDLDAIHKYGWKVADKQAYPAPMTYLPNEQVRRPNRDELLSYEAALRAIPIFVKEHLQEEQQGKRLPSEALIPVQISTGKVSVEINTPAGELPKMRSWKPQIADFEGEGEVETRFDRRAMEGAMASMIDEIGGEANGDPQLKKAQELMYDAWEERKPAKRIAIARQALKISPNCADAYVLLAEEEASTTEQALEYYQQGVEAGKRALGQEHFKAYSGHFWGIFDTRPYMRALEGLARVKWILGRHDEALKHYKELLRLNPGDNQGIRYVLVDLYLDLDREKDLEKLIKKYKDDWAAVWLYTKALLAFKKYGASVKAIQALDNALEQNPFTPDYLTGKKRVPLEAPEYIGWGDETEAISYAADHLNYWRRTPGAVQWLKERVSASSHKLMELQQARKKRGRK